MPNDQGLSQKKKRPTIKLNASSKIYYVVNTYLKMGALVPATLPMSSIRQTILIPYFCADAHFWRMADINRTENIRLGAGRCFLIRR